MHWKIEFTGQARQDLRNILDYITFDLQEPQIAVNLVRTITEEILSLDQMPMRYRLYDEEPWRTQGLHIVRIIYGGRDISRQLLEI